MYIVRPQSPVVISSLYVYMSMTYKYALYQVVVHTCQVVPGVPGSPNQSYHICFTYIGCHAAR